MFLTGHQTDFRGYLTYFCTLALQLDFSRKFQIYWLSHIKVAPWENSQANLFFYIFDYFYITLIYFH